MARNSNRHERERQADELRRKRGNRPPYQRVLIVCEGAKTEPIYFNDIRKKNRVPSAHVHIISADGTDPMQVVSSAEKKFGETKE